MMIHGPKVFLAQSALFVSQWPIGTLLWTVGMMILRAQSAFGSIWSINLLLWTVSVMTHGA